MWMAVWTCITPPCSFLIALRSDDYIAQGSIGGMVPLLLQSWVEKADVWSFLLCFGGPSVHGGQTRIGVERFSLHIKICNTKVASNKSVQHQVSASKGSNVLVHAEVAHEEYAPSASVLQQVRTILGAAWRQVRLRYGKGLCRQRLCHKWTFVRERFQDETDTARGKRTASQGRQTSYRQVFSPRQMRHSTWQSHSSPAG